MMFARARDVKEGALVSIKRFIGPVVGAVLASSCSSFAPQPIDTAMARGYAVCLQDMDIAVGGKITAELKEKEKSGGLGYEGVYKIYSRYREQILASNMEPKQKETLIRESSQCLERYLPPPSKVTAEDQFKLVQMCERYMKGDTGVSRTYTGEYEDVQPAVTNREGGFDILLNATFRGFSIASRSQRIAYRCLVRDGIIIEQGKVPVGS